MGAPAPKKKRRSAKAIIASGVRLAERSHELCLRGDLVAQMQELNARLGEVRKLEEDTGAESLGGGEPLELAQQIQGLREQMQEHTLQLTLRALPRRTYQKLMTEHPPRDGDQGDTVLGLNRDTFFEALVRYHDPATGVRTVVDPELDAEDWAAIDEGMSDGQWQGLCSTAWAVNSRDVNVPFSRAASQILANSGPE